VVPGSRVVRRWTAEEADGLPTLANRSAQVGASVPDASCLLRIEAVTEMYNTVVHMGANRHVTECTSTIAVCTVRVCRAEQPRDSNRANTVQYNDAPVRMHLLRVCAQIR
jgi:hypothetical protein